MRVIADHIRAMTFLIGDGVVPSNEWRGYVLRKIMRRAMRHGKKLGAREPFLHELVGVVSSEMGSAYPDLTEHQASIVRTVKSEEDRFDAVLDERPRATRRHPGPRRRHRRGGSPATISSGCTTRSACPWTSSRTWPASAASAIDREGFDQAMEAQRERARAASSFEARKVEDFQFRDQATRDRLVSLGDAFEGYTTTVVEGVGIAALFDEARRQIEVLSEGQRGWVILARTPFYTEAGGQVSDSGDLVTTDSGAGVAHVESMSRLVAGGPRAHHVVVGRGSLREGADGHGPRGRRASGRHPAEPHGHAPPPRRPAVGARRARQAGGVARRAGSPALRLRPLRPHHPRRD